MYGRWRRASIKFQTALALAVACLAATDSLSRPLPTYSPQDEHAEHEGTKHRLRQALESDPNNKEALFGLGQMMVEEGDFVSACPLFEKYVVISPAEPGAWAYLVRCAAGQNDPSAAADAQRQIERLAPANFPLHAQIACWLAGSAISEVTRHEFELVMSLAPSKSSGGGLWYSRLGQCYEKAHDPDRSARAFQAAIDIDPDTEGHYFRLAHLLASEGLAGPASAVMTSVVAHFPLSVAARVEAGRIELEAGNLERALELQHQATTLDPQFPGALSLLGRIQMALRGYPEAIATLEQAAKIVPGDAAIQFYAGQAWAKTEQGTERALEHFKRSLELEPGRASTYYWVGSLYFHRKHDYRLAVQYLEQAVDRGPELDAAHQMLIQAYKRLGENAKATRQLRRYQEIIQQRAKAETPR